MMIQVDVAVREWFEGEWKSSKQTTRWAKLHSSMREWCIESGKKGKCDIAMKIISVFRVCVY